MAGGGCGCLEGDGAEQSWEYLHGENRNGKSTVGFAEGRVLFLRSEMLQGSQHSLLVGWRVSWANKG